MDSYLDVRVRQSQLEGYYEPKARLLRQRLRALKAVEVTLALVAAALAAMAAISPNVGAWAAVVTTAGGAVAAYIAAERYEFLWIEYSRTASELRRLLDRRTAADGRPIVRLRTRRRVRASDLGAKPGMDGQVGRGERRHRQMIDKGTSKTGSSARKSTSFPSALQLRWYSAI